MRQLLQDAPDAVVNLGIAGGLDPTLRCGDVVVVEGWVAAQVPGRTIGPLAADVALVSSLVRRLTDAGCGHRTGRAVTVRRALWRPWQKARAHDETGALICEMEGLALGRACAEAAVPFAAVRVVADDVHTVLRRPPRMMPELLRALWSLSRAGAALKT